MNEENRDYYACPLCRHQRRRHDDNCVFGQYFPDNRSTDFERACRLFGLGNLLRLMRSVEPSERQVVADSILREANTWANDPIRGAFGHAVNLTSEIHFFEEELETVNKLLAYCQDQARQANPTSQMGISSSSNIPQQSTQLGGSSTQIPSLGGADIIASSFEKGDSSTVASKENEIIVKERDSEVDDKEKDITSDKDTYVKD
ncbi:LOB domain-containing protein 28 [Spatholobus suberectus]|nr:LOB domain-containing protein [Spatholobus suberectus]TKY68567.1 LOB domain-containing protein 28 [Spatholobus suberectus]